MPTLTQTTRMMQDATAFLAEKDSPNGSTRAAIPTTELSTSGGVVFNALTAQDNSARAKFTKAAVEAAKTAKPKAADGSELSAAQQAVKTVINTATAALADAVADADVAVTKVAAKAAADHAAASEPADNAQSAANTLQERADTLQGEADAVSLLGAIRNIN